MLLFTNRMLASAPDPSAYQRSFEPGATRLAVAAAKRQPAGGWVVSEHQPDASDVDVLGLLLPLFAGTRPVLVYFHGNNNTPTACLERCALLSTLYTVEVIGFSWTSEGYLPDGTGLSGVGAVPASSGETELKSVSAENRTDTGAQRAIRCYHQAQTNAQDSVDALARFLRLLGTARLHANAQPFTLAAHSLGAHLLQYTLAVPGVAESVGTAHNVVLLAPCVRAAGHRAWLAGLRPQGKVFVAYNQGDSVLFGARVADGGQEKLGADPGDERLQTGVARYVSFTHAATGPGGHGYFVYSKMPKKTRTLFGRIFGSELDIRADEHPRLVYPVGCDPDGLTCYMAAPSEPGLA